MRMLSSLELQQVAGAKVFIQKATPTVIEIVVTNSSRFVSAGTYGGHRLNVILYPNDICDLQDNSLGYDFSNPIFHNGHYVNAIPIQGGHIYQFLFNEG
ncbi:MAG: hypothetical protein AB7V32_01555 [Candidatus Berkiella sp.]